MPDLSPSMTSPRRLGAAAIALLLLAAPGPGGALFVSTPASRPLVAHEERPLQYDVLHYDLHLRFDERAGSVAGSTTVRLAPHTADFRLLELDAARLKIDRVASTDGQALSFTIDDEAEKLRIDLGRTYQPAEPVSVTITYSATPKRGLYFFPASSARGTAQFWSQGEAHDNHHWFPCWDYPNDKATADLRMTINERFVGVSNGALVSTRKNRDGTKTLHWRQDRPNAAYLMMVAAGEFAEVKQSWRKRQVIYVVPKAKKHLARAIFGRTPEMLEYFSNRIGLEYPWPKYTQICVSHFNFDGMENTSATVLSESILRDPVSSRSSDDLLAHELAHQWWGDLITCRDWPHAWLNEGFATFFELVWAEHAGGRAEYDRLLDAQADKIMRSEAPRRRPLVYNVYREPFDLFFDGTIYPKGAWVLHMLRRHLGDALFWKGVRLYAARHAYGVVATDDFRVAMEDASGQKLDWFFDQWVYRPGYPEFEISWSWDAAAAEAEVHVRQTQGGDAPVFKAAVDLELATAAGNVRQRVWLRTRDDVFRIKLGAAPTSAVLDPDKSLLKTVR